MPDDTKKKWRRIWYCTISWIWSLLLADDTKKKWYFYLIIGTILPAFIGLYLMSTGWFHMPAEAWECAATACTFLLFWRFHRPEATLESVDHEKERKLDGRMMAFVFPLVVVWCFLTWSGFIPSLSQWYRLLFRCLCGILIFAAICGMNAWLWSYWARQRKLNKPDSPANVNCVRYELLLCMVDLPIFFGLVTVLIGCFIIMKILPEHTIIAAFTYGKDNLAALDIHNARLSLASAFYSGAAAFHMLLGNAVFSFIQSGRLHKVIANHSKVEAPQQVAGANP